MTQDSPSRHMDKFMLRMPDGMRDRISEVSKSTGRSMNAEIIRRIELSFGYSSEMHIKAKDENTVSKFIYLLNQINNVDLVDFYAFPKPNKKTTHILHIRSSDLLDDEILLAICDRTNVDIMEHVYDS